MAYPDLAVTQGVISDFFEGDKAPRGTVNESSLRQTIMSILTRADDGYAGVPTLVYDAGFVDGLPDDNSTAVPAPAVPSTIVVTAHVPAVAEVPEDIGTGTPAAPEFPLVPGVAAIPGTITITEYDSEFVYTASSTTIGDVTNVENEVVDGGFDKLSVHYQNGTVTLTGKITEDIFEKPFSVRITNAYYDTDVAPMLLTVALPVPTP